MGDRNRSRAKGERGASVAEYALLMALFAVVLLAAITGVQGSASDRLDEVDVARHDARGVTSEVVR